MQIFGDILDDLFHFEKKIMQQWCFCLFSETRSECGRKNIMLIFSFQKTFWSSLVIKHKIEGNEKFEAGRSWSLMYNNLLKRHLELVQKLNWGGSRY